MPKSSMPMSRGVVTLALTCQAGTTSAKCRVVALLDHRADERVDAVALAGLGVSQGWRAADQI